MSTATATTESPVGPTPVFPPMVRHSLVLAGRAVKRIVRNPEQFIDVTLQPIIFVVLFVYIFGGAISGGTHDYLQYVLPAIMVQTVVFSSISIGVNLNSDIKEGIFDRFRSLPIPRSAPLLGAVVAELVRYATSIVVIIGFGYLLGFRVQTDAASALAACALVLLFAWCLCWIAVFLGMVMRESGSVQGIGFMVMMPMTFASNMFVPTDSMPGWLQGWVHVNPITHVVQAVRGLMLGGDVAGPVLWTLVTAGIIVAVFAPLAVGAYRRRA